MYIYLVIAPHVKGQSAVSKVQNHVVEKSSVIGKKLHTLRVCWSSEHRADKTNTDMHSSSQAM